MYQDPVYQAVTRNAERLYALQQEWCDDVLAVWAEMSLPAGFMPSSERVNKVASGAVTMTGTPAMVELAKLVLKDKIRSAGVARLLATAVYRSSAVWKAYSASTPTLLKHPDTAPACIAYLEISSLPSSVKPAPATLEAMLSPALEALLHHQDKIIQCHARQILVKVAKVDSTLVADLLAKLQYLFSQEALSDALRLCAENLVFLRDMHREIATFDSFAALETFVNTSLQWVVRRFAEDDHNDEATSTLIRTSGKWALRKRYVRCHVH